MSNLVARDFILVRDSAPAHISVATQAFTKEKKDKGNERLACI